MRGKILESTHLCVTIHRGKIVQHVTVEVDTREVRMLKCCIRVSPRISTKDPHPSPQVDVIFDLLSVCVHNDLYTFSNPYTLSILSHGCIVTLLVVCCISVVSSGFSTISCSEITRLRPVHVREFS